MKLICIGPFCSGIVYEVDDYILCPECGGEMAEIPDKEYYDRMGDL